MACKPTNFPNGIYAGACLSADADAVIELPQGIVEADDTYQVLVGNDIINCDGTFTVTLVDIADAIKEITVSSTNGTITLAGDATIETPTTVTVGSSVTLYPARGQWWHK